MSQLFKNGKFCQSLSLQKCKRKTDMEEVKESTHNFNLFRIESSYKTVTPKLSTKNNDFKVQVIVDNNITSVIQIQVLKLVYICGTSQANKWNLPSQMVPSEVKIKPYNSTPIRVHGEA